MSDVWLIFFKLSLGPKHFYKVLAGALCEIEHWQSIVKKISQQENNNLKKKQIFSEYVNHAASAYRHILQCTVVS